MWRRCWYSAPEQFTVWVSLSLVTTARWGWVVPGNPDPQIREEVNQEELCRLTSLSSEGEENCWGNLCGDVFLFTGRVTQLLFLGSLRDGKFILVPTKTWNTSSGVFHLTPLCSVWAPEQHLLIEGVKAALFCQILWLMSLKRHGILKGKENQVKRQLGKQRRKKNRKHPPIQINILVVKGRMTSS